MLNEDLPGSGTLAVTVVCTVTLSILLHGLTANPFTAVYWVSIRYVAWAYETAKRLQGKTMLIRIVSMLTKLGHRNHEVRENPGRYDCLDYDNDNGAKGSR